MYAKLKNKNKLMSLALVLLAATSGVAAYFTLATTLPPAASNQPDTQAITENPARQADQSKKDGEEALRQKNFDEAVTKFDEAKKLYSEAGNVVASEQMKDMLSVAKIEADMAEANSMQPGPAIDVSQEP